MLEQERQVRERSVTRPVTPKNARVSHIYSPLSGLGPGEGAVAYCGYVKQTPWSGRFWDGRPAADVCVVCTELGRGWGGR